MPFYSRWGTLRVKILIAPDKFKGSASAADVAADLARGLLRVLPQAEVRLVPMADGGDGTAAAVVEAAGGSWMEVEAHDPLLRPRRVRFGRIGPGGRTALIEMASCCGLALLQPEERQPLRTSSLGLGELIRYALDAGCTEVLLGIGGSATVDGGSGMLTALGARLLAADGRELVGSGGSLADLSAIDLSGLDPRLQTVPIRVACDVTNPLLGPTGAAPVFGPQKGASPAEVEMLEMNLARYADILERAVGRRVRDVPGTGAAGGIGFSLLAITPSARLQSGVELVAEAVGLDEAIAWADLVITGEGRLDGQTVHGKVPQGVARKARALGRPVVAVAGSITPEVHLDDNGLDAALSILAEPMSLEAAMAQVHSLLVQAGERLGSWLRVGVMLAARWSKRDENGALHGHKDYNGKE